MARFKGAPITHTHQRPQFSGIAFDLGVKPSDAALSIVDELVGHIETARTELTAAVPSCSARIGIR
jgi:hypothetical protein